MGYFISVVAGAFGIACLYYAREADDAGPRATSIFFGLCGVGFAVLFFFNPLI
ncbi:hypothetical protein [Rhizobium ruizarguesonis]|uniref:hypothetical protein n=1 Tax=Rhizobium ruizarguesonis TaxID=2081791 RepID=UPI0013EEAE39|nr:hypothetical protein [Rhizobium ruizarguesonis]